MLRGLAVLALAAALGQHGVELVHALTAEHVRCPEHGELLHGRGPEAAAESATSVVKTGTSDELRHDHCAVDWLARFQMDAPHPAVAPVLVESAAAVVSSPPATASRPLLSLAPKTSPPISPTA